MHSQMLPNMTFISLSDVLNGPLTLNEMAIERVAKAVEVGDSPILLEPCIDFLLGA